MNKTSYLEGFFIEHECFECSMYTSNAIDKYVVTMTKIDFNTKF